MRTWSRGNFEPLGAQEVFLAYNFPFYNLRELGPGTQVATHLDHSMSLEYGF